MKQSGIKTKIAGLSIIIVMSVLLRISFLSVPMTTDEGGCAYTALFWPEHQEIYKDINLDRMQGLFLVFKLILGFIGSDVEAFRFGAALYNALIIITVFFAGVSVRSEKTGWIAASIYTVISSAPLTEGFTASAELFTILPLTLSAVFLWKEQWKSAGLLAGLSLMFKPIGISGLIFLVLWLLIRKPGLRISLKSAAAASVFPLLSLMHGIYIGWEHLWDTFITSRLIASSGASVPFTDQYFKFISSAQFTASTWLLPLLFSAALLYYSEKKLKLFGLLWLATSFAGMTMGGQWHSHYYIQILPPVAVLGAAGIMEMFRRSKLLKTTAIVLSSISLLWLITDQGSYWLMSPDKISWNLFKRAEYLVADKIADYIKESTKPSDSIYIAFAEAEIYYLAQRQAAVPQQLYWLQVKHNRYIWEKLKAAIEDGKPEFIIWIQTPPSEFSSPEEFEQMILKNYKPDRKYGYILIYKKRGISGTV